MPSHQADIDQLQSELRDLGEAFLSEKECNRIAVSRLETRVVSVELKFDCYKEYTDKRIDDLLKELDTHHELVLQAIIKAEIDRL